MTDIQLDEVEKFAGLFMKPSDIAIILNIPESDFKSAINDSSTECFKRYHKGKLLSESELRKSVLTMAKQGSSPAQSLASKLIDEMNMDELD